MKSCPLVPSPISNFVLCHYGYNYTLFDKLLQKGSIKKKLIMQKFRGQIVIKNGIVISVETNTNVNGTIITTIDVHREKPDGTGIPKFTATIGAEEGGQKTGTIDEALSGLHSDVASCYKNLFNLANPMAQTIESLGFKNYELIQT